ncbi:uncharacterized protein [Nicotiana tomentosiformis]|uniref:uncharacterized protein n=1 Tax=Nicotiana tomentosiformis TaxID=4098 RepID=UPI00388C5B6C
MKVSVTRSKRLHDVTEDDITFTEEDADGLLLPHNDALVITLNVLDFNIKRVLTREFGKHYPMESAGTSQANRKHYSDHKAPCREILLPINAEGVMKTTLFEVVDSDMGYNIILGRPWLHEMKAVPSTYHQLLKFPSPYEINRIRGDQPAAREMNTISISSSKRKDHVA